MLIYKIIGNFPEDERFEKVLDKLKAHFYFLYSDGALFVSVIDYANREFAFAEMKKALKPAKDYFIIEIDENNLNREGPFFIDWCKENFVRLERQKYEMEQQKKLRMAMKAIDIFEEKMKASIEARNA